jgi:hypothetical protein
MTGQASLWAFVLAVIIGAPGYGGDCCAPPQQPFLQRLAPVGGWNPYGGGLLHWWDPCCAPHCGAPDDYCRKPLPRVCWPPYPPYYTWGPADGRPSQSHGPNGCNNPH